MKKVEPETKDELRKEYRRSDFGEMVRGKYAGRAAVLPDTVQIDPSLRELFPDSESVNRALREYAKEHNLPLAVNDDATSYGMEGQ